MLLEKFPCYVICTSLKFWMLKYTTSQSLSRANHDFWGLLGRSYIWRQQQLPICFQIREVTLRMYVTCDTKKLYQYCVLTHMLSWDQTCQKAVSWKVKWNSNLIFFSWNPKNPSRIIYLSLHGVVTLFDFWFLPEVMESTTGYGPPVWDFYLPWHRHSGMSGAKKYWIESWTSTKTLAL
jgi:hypothetical protein